MRNLLVIGGLMAVLTLNLFGQGSVNFANTTASRVWMWVPGSTPGTGTTTWIPVGPQFSADLMYAPDGTVPSEFDAVAIRVGASTTFGPVAGLFSGGGRTVNSIQPAGGFGLFQVRVWETAGGSYQAILQSGDSRYQIAKSPIVRVDTGDPTTTPPGTPAPLGLVSFGVTPIPEPSTIAIGMCGIGALLLLIQKRRER